MTMNYKTHRCRFCQALKADNSGGEVRFVVSFEYKGVFYAFLVFILTVLKPLFCDRDISVDSVVGTMICL